MGEDFFVVVEDYVVYFVVVDFELFDWCFGMYFVIMVFQVGVQCVGEGFGIVDWDVYVVVVYQWQDDVEVEVGVVVEWVYYCFGGVVGQGDFDFVVFELFVDVVLGVYCLGVYQFLVDLVLFYYQCLV